MNGKMNRDENKVWFELFVFDESISAYVLVARLRDPMYHDMFWYRYRVEAVSENVEHLLRDKKTWDECKFIVQLPGHDLPGPDDKETWTFSGGCLQYCCGETDEMSFRSLTPFDERDTTLVTLVFAPISVLWNAVRRIVGGKKND